MASKDIQFLFPGQMEKCHNIQKLNGFPILSDKKLPKFNLNIKSTKSRLLAKLRNQFQRKVELFLYTWATQYFASITELIFIQSNDSWVNYRIINILWLLDRCRVHVVPWHFHKNFETCWASCAKARLCHRGEAVGKQCSHLLLPWPSTSPQG